MTQSDYFWIPYELSLNLFQAFLYVWFLDCLLNKRKKERISFFVCVFLVFLAYSLYLFSDKLNLSIVFSDSWVKLIPAVYVFVFFRDRWWTKLLWLMIIMTVPASVTSLAYYGSALISGLSFEELLAPGFPRLIFTLGGNLLLFSILFLIVRLFTPPKKAGLTSVKSVLCLIIVDLSAYFVTELMFQLYPSGNVSNILFTGICALSLTVCLASLFLYRSLCSYSDEVSSLQYLQGQKDAVENRLAEISGMYTMMQLLQHDIQKHMNITEELLSEEKTEEGRSYLSEVSAKLQSLFSTGCLPLDSALTLRQKSLQAHKIAFLYELCDLQILPLPSTDFCAIIMNLLDNAEEASVRYYNETSEHFVKLSIRHHRDMFFIECINPCPSVVLRKLNGRFTSTKEESGHGLGLLMVEKIVSSIDGDCSFTLDRGRFRAYVALPYIEGKDKESSLKLQSSR